MGSKEARGDASRGDRTRRTPRRDWLRGDRGLQGSGAKNGPPRLLAAASPSRIGQI